MPGRKQIVPPPPLIRSGKVTSIGRGIEAMGTVDMRVREKSPADQAWIACPSSAGGRIAEIGHYGIAIRDEIELVVAFG